MFRVLAFMLCLVLCSCSHFQTIQDQSDVMTCINIIDKEGLSETISNKDRLQQYQYVDFLKPQPYQKVLRVYGRDCEGNHHAFITTYHANSELKQYLEIVNGRAYGFYREYFSDGVLKLEAFIIGGMADVNTTAEKTWLFDNCAQVWNEDGSLAAEINYSKGELDGLSTYYHPNGKIWKKVPFCRNKMEGTFEIFLDDGSLLQTANYSDGIKSGPSMRYWPCEKVAADEIYCEGLLQTGRYYDNNGDLISEVNDGHGYRVLFSRDSIAEMHQFQNGKLDGDVKVFGKNGRLVRIYHMRDGVKHGEEIEYYDPMQSRLSSQPMLSINWVEGKIQGMVKTWYPTGLQESQREMTDNVKNGLLTAWYLDGSMMLIEEYDHDKLIKGEYFKRGEKIPISTVADSKGIATIFDSHGNFTRKVEYVDGKPTE